ncbi:MAG: RNA polymerase sigma factor [Candidatus Dojkabacteria bacterium]
MNEFAKIYKEYFDYIYYFVYRRLSNFDDTEDVVSEVFMAVWKSLENFDQSRSIKSWMIGITLHKLNDFLRRKYKIRENVVAVDVELIGEVEKGRTISSEKLRYIRILEELVNALKERDQKFVEYRFKRNYTLAETAKELNVTTNNAKVIQNRLVKKLKKLWLEYQS